MKNLNKTILAIAIMLACYLPSNATHLMGGDIGITKDVNGAFILEHVNFRDTLGIPAYAQAQFKIEKWDTATNTWVYIGSDVMPQDSAASGGLLVGIPYGIQIYNYKSLPGVVDSIFVQNGQGKYRFITYDCCRNIAILNLSNPGGESFVITCEYTYDPAPTASKFSPEFLAIPIIYGPVNNAWVYNPLPFDADGDSLSWTLNTPFGSYNQAAGPIACAGYTVPSATATGPFTLNTTTGQVDWTPNMVGNYVASFEITEYSNGVEIGKVLRDMQYVVIPDSNSNGPIAMPEFTSVSNYGTQPSSPGSNNSYNYYYYDAGAPMSFTIAANDLNNNDVLSMTAFGALFNNGSNASFSFTPTGSGNTVHGTFTWTPNHAETKDYTIVIRANDGAFSKDFTLILKKWVAPTAIDEVTNDKVMIAIYPNPTHENERVNIKISSQEATEAMQLRVLDITGKVISAQTIEKLPAGNHTISMNANNLGSGLYFAEFVGEKVALQTVKFVVQ